MGIKLPRQKNRHFLLSVLYSIHKLLPFSDRKKLKLYLDLEWIFERLALETSFKHYGAEDHPIRKHALDFISRRIGPEDHVLDLGCKTGQMSWEIAEMAAHVVGIDHD